MLENSVLSFCSFTREGCHSTWKVTQLVPEAAETLQGQILYITNFNKLICHYHHETCTTHYICAKSNLIRSVFVVHNQVKRFGSEKFNLLSDVSSYHN